MATDDNPESEIDYAKLLEESMAENRTVLAPRKRLPLLRDAEQRAVGAEPALAAPYETQGADAALEPPDTSKVWPTSPAPIAAIPAADGTLIDQRTRKPIVPSLDDSFKDFTSNVHTLHIGALRRLLEDERRALIAEHQRKLATLDTHLDAVNALGDRYKITPPRD